MSSRANAHYFMVPESAGKGLLIDIVYCCKQAGVVLVGQIGAVVCNLASQQGSGSLLVPA